MSDIVSDIVDKKTNKTDRKKGRNNRNKTGNNRTYSNTQVMLSHAFASYIGSGSPAFSRDHLDNIETNIHEALVTWPALTEEGWELVWGPVSVELLPISIFDINLMYVARNIKDPHRYVIAIRGTNPFSLPNWMLEDFLVAKQKNWLFAPGSFRPKISLATFNGLYALTTAVAEKGTWGVGDTLAELIKKGIEAADQPVEINITGHSLGGAMAPAVGLWLADTQASWDPEGKATLAVYAFAGPSPGNEQFKTHFHEMFQDRYHGVVNHNDVVTKGWEYQSTQSIPNTYQPTIKPDLFVRAFFKGLAFPLNWNEYSRLTPGNESFEGEIITDLCSFWPQAIYQHTVAYLKQFELLPTGFSWEDIAKWSWREVIAETRQQCLKVDSNNSD